MRIGLSFILFFTIFITIYGGVHYYIFSNIVKLIKLSLKLKIILVVLFISMTISMPLSRITEYLYPDTGKKLTLASYIWMGFIFYVFILFLIRSILLYLEKIIGILKRQELFFIKNILSNSIVLPLIILLSVITCIYSYNEALDIKINTLQIPDYRSHPVNIIQISDVHLGTIVGHERLSKIISLINDANPDILVITGDLIDSDLDNIDKLSPLLSAVKPRYGKYAVTGNHEFYAGIDKAQKFYKDAGIKLLRDEVEIIPGILNIIGVDDPAVKIIGTNIKRKDIYQLTKETDKKLFTLLLNHQPKDFDIAESLGVNMQLSGHTHNGQIFPFNLLVYIFYHPVTGLHKINNAFLYISKGTGTWGPPMRFLSQPEVTLIKITDNMKP
ncbi:metallophosphoesterase [Candidatus Desantisbacteria bacterium]|nr:metallophosphoesterase [Candidatus Desantisbacteria bacterium]